MKLDIQKNNVWIFGFGAAGKWASDNINSNVKGFIDSGAAKHGHKYSDLVVYSPDEAQKLIEGDDVILVTVLDIQDVIPVIEANFPNNQFFAIGDFFDNEKANLNHTEASDEFIEYSLKAVEMCHKSYLRKDRQFLHSVDVVISEKCSLNCKDCSNLMQYYKSTKNLTYDTVVEDFDRMMGKIKHVYEVRLIGGEPFMNKDIYKIIEYLTKCPKITKLVIYSNAMVPIKPEYQNILRDKKVVFALTNYEDYAKNAKNTLRVTESLDAIGVAYRLHPPETLTDSGVIKDFKRTIDENKKLFSDCCGKNLLTVTDGKLYRCPFAANADRLNAVPKSNLNSVSVKASTNEITNYISKIDYLPACNWCKGRSWDSPEIIPAVQTVKPISYVKYQKSIAT